MKTVITLEPKISGLEEMSATVDRINDLIYELQQAIEELADCKVTVEVDVPQPQ